MESYLTARISASAVRSNLEHLRGLLGQGVKLCPVVKADCYGHGLEHLLGVISPLADELAVASPTEAIGLRQCGYEGEVLMFFSPCAYGDQGRLRDALEELILRDITLTVVARREIDAVARAAERTGKQARLHVKIDTGMTRSGVPYQGAEEIVAEIRRTRGVRLAGMYTHFAVSDEPDRADFTRRQLERFLAAADASGQRRGLTLHAANSAALVDYPDTHLDMVRPGIAVYGYQPSDKVTNKLPLRPCMQLTARLIQIKDVPEGSACGYGLTHTFTRPSRIALVAVGYGDGYLRALSNRAVMRIAGAEAPVRGRISMDQTIIDVTGAPEARLGGEVEIISPDPEAPNSVENLARLAGTIPYEITCRLGGRIRRVPAD